jgi:hypothetical protein
VATPLCVRARQCNPFHFRLDQAGQRAAAPGVTFYIRGVPAEMMGIEGVLAEAMQGLPQGTSDVKVAGRWHADSRMTSIKYGIMQMCAVGTAPQPPTDPDTVARVTDMLTAINRGQALSPALRMSLEHQANAVLLEQWFDLLFENPRDNAHAQQLVATMSAARGLFDICPLVTMLAPAATADGARTLGRDEMRALMADVNTGTHGVAVSVPVTVSAFTSSGRTSAPYQMSPPTIAVHGYVPVSTWHMRQHAPSHLLPVPCSRPWLESRGRRRWRKPPSHPRRSLRSTRPADPPSPTATGSRRRSARPTHSCRRVLLCCNIVATTNVMHHEYKKIQHTV